MSPVAPSIADAPTMRCGVVCANAALEAAAKAALAARNVRREAGRKDSFIDPTPYQEMVCGRCTRFPVKIAYVNPNGAPNIDFRGNPKDGQDLLTGGDGTLDTYRLSFTRQRG